MKMESLNTEVLAFLNQLAEAQKQMLVVLHKKQAVLVKPEKKMMETASDKEGEALEVMQQILNRREEILTTARKHKLPSDSIEELCAHFFPRNIEIHKKLDEAKHRTHQIQLLAYTNWTMSRKSMIHISQILELLETRGQGKTTYNPHAKENGTRTSFVDRVA